MTAHRVAVLPRNRGEILVRRQSREKPDPQLTPLTASLDDDPAAVARQCLHAEAGIPDAVMDVARVGEPVEGDVQEWGEHVNGTMVAHYTHEFTQNGVAGDEIGRASCRERVCPYV